MNIQSFIERLNKKAEEYNSNNENTIKLLKWREEKGKPVFIE